MEVPALRHKPVLAHHDRLAKIVLCVMILVPALLMAPLARPDLHQDYNAACAWWSNTFVGGLAALAACPENLTRAQITETAHPPAATLVLLPLALLGWPQAYAVWIVLGALCVGLTWIRYNIPSSVCLATAPVVYLGLHRGAIEPLLFLLLATALYVEERRPYRAAALIGFAAGLKVYPGLLLAAFFWRRRFREFGLAVLCALGITAAAELILGPGVTLAWLRFTPENVARFITNPDNVSLVRIARNSALALPVALVIYALLTWGLRRRLRYPDGMRALVPVALMATPLVWSHYLVALSLASLGRTEIVLLGVGGVLLVVSSMTPLSIDSAALVYAPLVVATATAWLRAWREGATRPSPGSYHFGPFRLP